MYCNKCGNEIPDGSEFCSKCGTKLNQNKKQKVKKQTSKSTRIVLIVLLSLLFIYFVIMLILGIKNNKVYQADPIAFGCSLVLLFLIGYGLVSNILKLVRKDKKYTSEQLQKRKKRNTILGLSSVTAVVLIIVVMLGYGNISESNEKEQMISKIKEYRDNDYFVYSDEELQELETHSNSEIKEILDSIETKKKLLEEYNEKYSAKLDEIFAKEIQFELYESEDNMYKYIPFNTSTGERQSKAQIECVTISKSANQIADIYYSVEMNLTVYNKYSGKAISKGLTKKFYKILYLRDLDKVQKINNYNDQAIQDEISNAISGKTGVIVAVTSENKNYSYSFTNIEK